MPRLRKPLAILKATGQYRADRHASRCDDRVAIGNLQRPEWLDGDAAWAWDTITGGLTPGVLASLDVLTLAMTCRWWALWRRWDKQLQSSRCKNVYKITMQAAVAQKNFDRSASKLGLTPVDRAKLQAPPEEKQQDQKSRFFQA